MALMLSINTMRVIPYLHDFIGELPQQVQEEIAHASTVRHLAIGEAAYRKDDLPREIFRLTEGAIKLCNYSLDGAEIAMGEFRPGDCFGEMGVLDDLPRISHAIASRASVVRVISKQSFETLCEEYSIINRHLARMLTRRVRFLYSLLEESIGLKLHVRLARVLHRLAYSHGLRIGQNRIHIEVSHEELSNMLGASRQSVSKELKSLESEGDIELRYGKIFFRDLGLLGEKYEQAIGMEQFTPIYDDQM